MRTRIRRALGPRVSFEASCASTVARRAAGAAGKTAKNESPSVPTTRPSFASTADRTMS